MNSWSKQVYMEDKTEETQSDIMLHWIVYSAAYCTQEGTHLFTSVQETRTVTQQVGN